MSCYHMTDKMKKVLINKGWTQKQLQSVDGLKSLLNLIEHQVAKNGFISLWVIFLANIWNTLLFYSNICKAKHLCAKGCIDFQWKKNYLISGIRQMSVKRKIRQIILLAIEAIEHVC